MYDPRLETFLCVADNGSFNKAAEVLYISPPAVIKQINGLEKSLGFSLFLRTHRGLFLTAAGASLAEDARYVIQYSKDSIVRARRAMEQGAETIRIGSSPMTPAQVLVDLMPLKRTPLCCALSLHHPLARKDFLTVEDLHGEALMLIREGWNHYVDELRHDLMDGHPEIKLIDFDFYDTEAFNECDRKNALLMAVPQWEAVHPLLKILPVRWDYTVPYGLLYGHKPSAPVKRFLHALAQITERFTKNEL